MSSIRFLLAPVLSLFDLKLYREAAPLPAGKSVSYLVYLSFIFGCALFVFSLIFMPKVDDFVDWLKANTPAMTVTNSGMTMDESGRKELNHPTLGPIAVFDGTRESIQPGEMGAYYLYMTSKVVYVRQGEAIQANKIGSQAKKNFKLRVDAETIQAVYSRIKVPVVVVLLAAGLFLNFVTRIAVAVFLAIAGFAVQLFVPRRLAFRNLFNIAAFALSPAVICSILQLNPALAAFSIGLLGILLSVTYFVIGIIVQPKTPQEASSN